MKAKYLFSATLCCIALIACQGNDPNNENNKPSTEVIERLSDLVDGIGTIIDSKTLEDGSIVMTDNKGNTITKDKDGNITIITKDGETSFALSSSPFLTMTGLVSAFIRVKSGNIFIKYLKIKNADILCPQTKMSIFLCPSR